MASEIQDKVALELLRIEQARARRESAFFFQYSSAIISATVAISALALGLWQGNLDTKDRVAAENLTATRHTENLELASIQFVIENSEKNFSGDRDDGIRLARFYTAAMLNEIAVDFAQRLGIFGGEYFSLLSTEIVRNVDLAVKVDLAVEFEQAKTRLAAQIRDGSVNDTNVAALYANPKLPPSFKRELDGVQRVLTLFLETKPQWSDEEKMTFRADKSREFLAKKIMSSTTTFAIFEKIEPQLN